MEPLLHGVIALCLTAMVLALWGLIVNERTFKQRGRLIDSIGVRSPDFYERMDEFRAVSYDQHFWRLFFLGSAQRLYSPRLWNRAA